MKFVPPMWPRCRAWRGLLVAVVMFAALQAARPGYYFQHVATVIFEEIDPAGFEKSGLVVGGFGRAHLSSLLTSEIIQRVTPEAIETLRGESAILGGISAGSADAVLIRECRMRVGDNGRHGRRTLALTVGASDPQQAEHLGRQVQMGVMMFDYLRQLEPINEQAQVLSAEIKRLGDEATEEMRQQLRALNMRPLGRTIPVVISVPPHRPQVSETKHFVLWRFFRLAAFNGSIAAVAGLIVFAISTRRGRAGT